MDRFEVPKPVAIAVAVLFALGIGSGLWVKFNPPGISQKFQLQDAERARREEADPEKLRNGTTPEAAAIANFHSDKAYQPESGAR